MEKKIKKVKPKTVENKPVINKKEEKRDFLNSYLLFFKLEGRNGWRKTFYPTKDALVVYLAGPGQKDHAKIVEKKWFLIDNINATVTEE